MDRSIKSNDTLQIIAACANGWASGETLALALARLCHNFFARKCDFTKALLNGKVSVFVSNADKVEVYPSCVYTTEEGKAILALSKTNDERINKDL
jgi:hypothetical protein